MRLFIPPLGTKLFLLKPWKFELHCEYRNRSLWDLMTDNPLDSVPLRHRRFQDKLTMTLDPGTVLKVSRIFIRKGASNYDSVTFTGEVKKFGVLRKVRFWVSLEDANNVDAKVV